MFERIKQIKVDKQASKKSTTAVIVLAISLLSGISYAGGGAKSFEQQLYRTPPAPKEALTPLLRVEPQYPAKAVDEQLEGAVVLKFDVDVSGDVINIEVMNGEPAYVFDRVAVEALKQWKYKALANVSRNNLVQLDFVLGANSSYSSRSLIEKIKVTQ